MKTFNQLLTDYKTISRDSSSANETLGKQQLNDFIKKILSLGDWTFNGGEFTDLTVVDQQYYPLAYDSWRTRKVTVKVGTVTYTLEEVKSERDWEILNRTDISSTVPTNFYIKSDTNELGLYPIPSTAGYTITQFYQKKVIDYGADDYETGTVTVTNGSEDVVGVGTTFASAMVGRYLKASNFWYKITGYTDATHITIREYGEDTVSGVTYTIAEIPLPDGLENLPLWGALGVYFQSRENAGQGNQYRALYEGGIADLMKRDAKTTGNVFSQTDGASPVDINQYPEIS